MVDARSPDNPSSVYAMVVRDPVMGVVRVHLGQGSVAVIEPTSVVDELGRREVTVTWSDGRDFRTTDVTAAVGEVLDLDRVGW